MLRWIALALCLMAAPLWAQDLPNLFRVMGVAQNDQLNIRAQPNARAQIIGSLAHDAQHIEVVSQQGNWGQVNLREGSGWVALRFMQVEDTTLYETLDFDATCFGTEPFWSLAVDSGARLHWHPADGTKQSYLAGLLRGIARAPVQYWMAGSAGDRQIHLLMTRVACNDGMSDRNYGLQAVVTLMNDDPRGYTGCCSIRPR